MINIDNWELSKDIILWENFWLKIQKMVNDVNAKISTINDDEKNIYIKKTFIKLWRLLKSKENNWINSEEFNKILLFIGLFLVFLI